MNSLPLLTIAIPTYNRNLLLLDNLRRLIPQLQQHGARVCLLVVDNASDVPVEKTLRPLLDQYEDVRCEVIRNVTNVGANANILRCFELCRTSYLWVLSDDDTPPDNALETVFDAIERYPDALGLNFSSELCQQHSPRTGETVTRGLEQFVDKCGYFGNVLLISTNVYKRAALGDLRLGYTYLYSHAPHLITLLTALGHDGACVFSDRQIAHYNPPQLAQQWSFVNLGLGIMTLLELPMPARVRFKLARRIVRDHPKLEYFVVQLLLQAQNRKEAATALFLYDQLCSRMFGFETGLKHWLKVRAFRLMIQSPRLGLRLLVLLKGRKADKYLLQNRFERG